MVLGWIKERAHMALWLWNTVVLRALWLLWPLVGGLLSIWSLLTLTTFTAVGPGLWNSWFHLSAGTLALTALCWPMTRPASSSYWLWKIQSLCSILPETSGSWDLSTALAASWDIKQKTFVLSTFFHSPNRPKPCLSYLSFPVWTRVRRGWFLSLLLEASLT